MLRITKKISVKNINLGDIQHDLKCLEDRLEVKIALDNKIDYFEEFKKLGIDTDKEEVKDIQESIQQDHLDLLKCLRIAKECVDNIIIDQDQEDEISLEIERLNIELLVAEFNYLRHILSRY